MISDTSSQDRLLAPGPRRPRRALAIAAAAALLAVAAWALPQARRLIAPSDSVSVDRLGIAEVTRGPFVRDIEAEGKVVAAFSPTLFAPQPGSATLLVHAGDSVKKGQALATIASPDLAARLAQERASADTMQTETLRAQVDANRQRAQAQGARESAAIDVKAAETDLERQQRAFDKGAAAGMQVDHARDTLEKARLTLTHAESALRLEDDSLKFDVRAREQAHARQVLLVNDLERQVGELTVRSPVDGQVGQLLVAERASVARDAPLLTVVDLSALEVETHVAESFARELAPGMPGEISGNGRSWKAHVRAVSPEVVNNEVAARLSFDGVPPGDLRQSQRLGVRVLLDRRDDVLSVRAGSFIDEGGGAQAYVVRDGVAQKTAVRLGARSVERVEILSGLQAGDQVVVSGADNFHGAPSVALSR
jgi:HlyD family secretion protein